MKSSRNAPLSATDNCALNSGSEVISIQRSALEIVAEMVEDGIREAYGWEQKASSPIDIGKLMLAVSDRPHVRYPGLAGLLSAHEMLVLLAETPELDDEQPDLSPEGEAIKKLAARDRTSGWDHRYRRLEHGEVIKTGDEVLTDSHLGWRPAIHTIGQTAPDPAYSSHRLYRRRKTAGAI